MADWPLLGDEARRRMALERDRQLGIDPGPGNERGYAFNQWLPLSTNKVGSPSWVQEGSNPKPAVPEIFQGGVKGVADLYDSPRTGKLTPEALTSLLAGSTLTGGILAPRGSLAAGGSIKAYHGSPHDFERFDFSKIGTGEGAQVKGHGLYFAEHEPVATSYRDALAAGGATIDGVPIRDLAATKHRLGINETPTPVQDVADYVLSYQQNARFMIEKRVPELLPVYDALKKSGALKDTGHMYEVNINADPKRFLDYDKPLSRQSPDVQQALSRFGIKADPVGMSQFDDALLAALQDKGPTKLPRQPSDPLGANIYESSKLVPGGYRDPVAASATLKEAGIPGITYLDQGSRTGGAGTRNYVVFPTQEEIIQILRKYGLAAPSPVVPGAQGAPPTPGLLSDRQSEVPISERVY